MKKLFILLAMMWAAVSGWAQDIELTPAGTYERKTVVHVDSTQADVLFVRAMEALSDWTGPDGKAKFGIDFQDKDAGTVIYKGTMYLGFRGNFTGDGWERYANIVLKVRCKDGRAQVTVTMPSVLFNYTGNGMRRTLSVAEVIKMVDESSGKRHNRGLQVIADMKRIVNTLTHAMTERLRYGADDDDF